jgi:hypothetical protein
MQFSTAITLLLCATSLDTTVGDGILRRKLTQRAAQTSEHVSSVHPSPHFRKDIAADTKVSKILSAVYNEQKRWENAPSRREPFNLERLDDMRREFVNCGLGCNTLFVSLLDWFECGLFAGLRLG